MSNINLTGLQDGAPVVASYGLGVDSTAVLTLLHSQGIRPDAILFADVGNEKAETYAYLEHIQSWLARVGFPSLDIVRYEVQRVKYNPYSTLLGNCIANRTLPSIAFFRHGCSLKWKGDELDKRVTELFGNAPAYRLIGYDASPADLRRFGRATKKKSGTRKRPSDLFVYPLIDVGWERPMCIAEIEAAGLPVPPKSSCTFCSSMKPEEVADLPIDALLEIVILEANASPNLTSIKGLWHKERMSDFIAGRLLPAPMVESIWARWATEERVLPADQETNADKFLAKEVEKLMQELEAIR